jgi:hypothetical protein
VTRAGTRGTKRCRIAASAKPLGQPQLFAFWLVQPKLEVNTSAWKRMECTRRNERPGSVAAVVAMREEAKGKEYLEKYLLRLRGNRLARGA